MSEIESIDIEIINSQTLLIPSSTSTIVNKITNSWTSWIKPTIMFNSLVLVSVVTAFPVAIINNWNETKKLNFYFG